MTRTVMTTNNAYDSILLVDDNDDVISAMTATPQLVAYYLAHGSDASLWDANQWDGFDGSCAHIEDYGEESGRDGIIANPRRAQYWAGKIAKESAQ